MLFSNDKNKLAYEAVEAITNVIIESRGLKFPKQVVKEHQKMKKEIEALWEIALNDYISKDGISIDVSPAFAARGRTKAKKSLSLLRDAFNTIDYKPFRISAFKNRYFVTYIPNNKMAKLWYTLKKYGGEYDAWFDFDIGNLLIIPKKDRKVKVAVPPLSPESKIWQSMEAITRAVSRPPNVEEDLSTLRRLLSEGGQRRAYSIDEQFYWKCLMNAINYRLQRDDDSIDVVEDTLSFACYGLDQDQRLYPEDIYVPNGSGLFLALYALAEELKDRGILLGWMQSPAELNALVPESMHQYSLVAIINGNEAELEQLFAYCGGAIHFNFNDPERIDPPLDDDDDDDDDDNDDDDDDDNDDDDDDDDDDDY
jgi:hypothetical protein